MDPYFAKLGRAVFDRWKARNFSLPDFPKIAAEALRASPPAKHVDLDGLVRGFLLDDAQPFQTHSGFGQPEIVVFDDPRFYIQVLFWMEGTTDIHQHEFSGAFHVLAGSSIHSEFAFDEVAAVTPHLRLGNLRMTRTELLEAGRTVPIVSGRAHIHSLFHLDTPSATVVVRTQTDPGTGPQYTYLPPHVAVNPVHDDALTMRRKQLLDVIEQTDAARWTELVKEMIGALDFERGFFILQSTMAGLRALGAWDEVWAVFRRRHGKLARFVPATLDEIVRRDGIAAMRAAITDARQRFFLALLLNVPARDDILAMVARRFRGDPRATIVRWAGELLEDGGGWLVDAELPAGLGHAEVLSGLAHFLGLGAPPDVPPGRVKALRGALVRSSWRVLLEPQSPGVAARPPR